MPSNKLRVAMLSQHYAEYVSLLTQGLAEKCEVLVILNCENAKDELGVDWKTHFNLASLRTLPLPKAQTLATVWSNYRQVKEALKQFKPDVIHCQEGGIRDELVPLLVGWRGRPLVLTVHDPASHSGTDARRLRFSRHRVYRTLIRSLCTAVITHGDALCDALVKIDGRFEGRVFSVPHGALGPCNLEFDTSWIPGNLLFFGRIHEYKGLGNFIAAVRRVAERGFPVLGVIAGRGPDLDKYRKDIAGSALFEIHDRFIPPSEVDELFKRANAVVLPYIDGTQSGVAALALGYGRPVIATNVAAVSELVHDGVNGLLVAPFSPDKLVDAIELVLRDREFAVRLAKNSWEMGRGELSWRGIAARTINVYESLTGKAAS